MSAGNLVAYSQRLQNIKSIYQSLESTYRRTNTAFPRPPATVARLAQLQGAVEHMGYLSARVEALMAYNDETIVIPLFERIIRQRCSIEAFDGICDTLLVVPCKNAGRQIHQTLFDTLCALNPKSSPSEMFGRSAVMMQNFPLIFTPLADPAKKPLEQVPINDSDNATVFDVKTPNSIESESDKDPKRADNRGLQPSAAQTQGDARNLENWPDVKVSQAARTRIRRTLNPLFTDHSTTSGLPKPLHAEPASGTPLPSASDQPKIRAPKHGTFEYFLANYKPPGSHRINIDLLLTLFLVEYKKASDETGHKATNQARTYAAAVLQFFRTLGIENQPVYLFATDGNQGVLSMAMYNKDAESNEVCAIVHVFVSELTARVVRDNHSSWSGTYVCMISGTLAIPTNFPFSCKHLRAEPKSYRRSSRTLTFPLSSSVSRKIQTF